ncbi:MAG: helix-turn-helix domain-containing protein [Oscillospiraceae bacterium]|nr:helix-turn-helix domain-containing protein [Oscillospiraceae bacterium]
MSAFSERLAELRKDRGLNQRELAKILFVSEDMISAYERGISQMSDDTKIKLAKYFNISLDYLLGLIDDEIDYQRKDILVYPKCFNQDEIDKVEHYVDLLEMEIEHKRQLMPQLQLGEM